MPNNRASVKANQPSLPMLDLRRFKKSMVSKNMHSPFVKHKLNLRSVCSRIVPKDLIYLTKAVLEAGPQLPWSIWFREEAKTIEQFSKAWGVEVSQDQLLGEGNYDTVERKYLYEDHFLPLCCKAVLSAWDRIKQSKKVESFTKVIQGLVEV